jgi:D-3-phosphoglycerate dehydrogenase
MHLPLRLVAVGDPFLDVDTLRDVIEPVLPEGAELDAVQWPLSGKEELQRINLEVEQGGLETVDPHPDVLGHLAEADILFTQFFPVSARVLNAAPKLRVIGVGRSGVENVNVEEATARGVAVLNTLGRNAQAVAEYTIGLLLCEARNIGRGHAALTQGVWRKQYPNDESVPELPERTVGLIGLGHIGRLVVKKLSGFDMRFLAYDPFVTEEQAAAAGVELTDLQTLMKTADFVTVHAKLTEETRHLVNREMLALMKPTAYLINTARSELVDEAALVECLRDRQIAGAALDVFVQEPPDAGDPLLALDNVTLSPHQAGVTVDAYRTTAKLFAQNISRLWEGDDPPANLVNEAARSALLDFKQAVQSGAGA